MTCIYVSSFECRPGSFGDYSLKFQCVLEEVFEELVVCDVTPWVDYNKVTSVLHSINTRAEEMVNKLEKVDAIYFEAVQYHAVVWTMIKALTRLVPTVKIYGTIHDCPYAFSKSILSLWPTRLFNFWKFARFLDYTPIGKAIQKQVTQSIDHTFLLSHEGVEMYQQHWGGNNKVSSLRHVLLREEYGPDPKSALPELFTLYYSGSWWTHKGIEVLIEAVELLHTKYGMKAKLILSGRCDHQFYQDSIENQLRDLSAIQETEYVGYESFDEMRNTAMRSHVWVVPYNEAPKVACSGIMNLAISCGSCIVSSDLPQFNELIEDKVNGRVFETGNSSSLAHVLSELAQDPQSVISLREAMWNGNREKMKKNSIAKELANSISS